MMTFPIITIDGPSGSGKGTLASRIAAKYGFHLLDSGALYRAVGFHAQALNINFDDHAAMADVALNLPISFEQSEQGIEVLLNDKPVGSQLRTEETGKLASSVAVIPEVREALVQLQKGFVKAPGLVADGRDMGTVIFPDAPAKFFLDASVEERAKRRYKQLKEKGFDVNLAALENELQIRDDRDRSRTVSPLVPADDALVIDSTALSAEAVFDLVVKTIESKVTIKTA